MVNHQMNNHCEAKSDYPLKFVSKVISIADGYKFAGRKYSLLDEPLRLMHAGGGAQRIWKSLFTSTGKVQGWGTPLNSHRRSPATQPTPAVEGRTAAILPWPRVQLSRR